MKTKKTAAKTAVKKTEKKEKPKKVKKVVERKVKKITAKRVAKKVVKKEIEIEKPKPAVKPAQFFEAVGRRKTSVARVRIWTKGEKEFLVNNKPFNIYFFTLELQQIASAAFEKMNCLDKFRTSVKVKGGGIHSQAEAVRHGLARVLTLFNPDFRKRLKKAGFLTRDSRMKERKKFGLKGARRAPQWAKR